MQHRTPIHCAITAGLAVGFSAMAGAPARAADINWDAASGDWFVNTNWDPQTVPTAGDIAFVDAGTSQVTSGTAEASKLNLGGGWTPGGGVGHMEVLGGELITGGATLNSFDLPGNSSVLVNGSSSIWTNNGSMSFNDIESNDGVVITVSGGGTIYSESISSGSAGPNSSQGPYSAVNPVTVTGPGSSITTVNQMVVSDLTIQDQGTVTNGSTAIGSSDNTKGIVVDGPGSLQQTTGKLDINWGTVYVQNGGDATAGSMAVGGSLLLDDHHTGQLFVDGSGSTLDVTGLLQIGDTLGLDGPSGGNGSMSITNDGNVQSGAGWVSRGQNAFIALVDGLGSAWDISGDFTLHGVLKMHSNGDVSVGGNYAQGAIGELEVQLVDVLQEGVDVTGNAAIDGGLTIQIDSGFLPQLGDTFDLLTTINGSVSGTFSSVVLDIEPGLDAYEGQVIYNSNSVQYQITGVPEPTTLAILSILGFGAAVRRR